MMYQQVLEGHEKGYGIEHPWTLNTVYNLGNFQVEHDQLAAAEALYQRAREGYEKVFGPEDPNTVCAVKRLRELDKRKKSTSGTMGSASMTQD
jgi:Tetratricopeptide repeat